MESQKADFGEVLGMLILIETQRIADLLRHYLDGREECRECGDEDNARIWHERFVGAKDFLERLGFMVDVEGRSVYVRPVGAVSYRKTWHEED